MPVRINRPSDLEKDCNYHLVLNILLHPNQRLWALSLLQYPQLGQFTVSQRKLLVFGLPSSGFLNEGLSIMFSYFSSAMV